MECIKIKNTVRVGLPSTKVIEVLQMINKHFTGKTSINPDETVSEKHEEVAFNVQKSHDITVVATIWEDGRIEYSVEQ